MSNRKIDFSRIPGARPTGLSRRGVLQALGVGGATLAGGSLLAACGTDPETTAPGGVAAEDRSDTDKTVNFSNWIEYIDVDEEDENLRPTLEAFKESTGVTVNYTEDINDNDDFFGQIRPQPVEEFAVGVEGVDGEIGDRLVHLVVHVAG